jgi:flagellar hook-length control protein FliK
MAARPGTVPFEPPDSQTVPVVRQQLEMLNTGQFVWQGEVWNGQKMTWNISRDEKRKKSSQARSWDTDLSLELPNLGAVTASVRITGNQARITITASEAHTATSMETQSNRLIQGLENGGLTLASLEVKHGQTS